MNAICELSEDEVRRALRKHIDKSGLYPAAWAERHGFTQPFLSMVLSGKKQPSARICEAIGITKATVYTVNL